MSTTTTEISWTDRTWNPVRGCSIASKGCINCYAARQAHRFSGPGKPFEGLTKQTKAGPQWTGKVVTVESALLEPLSWRKPQRVFVNSMSDLFHDDVPFEFIDRVFATMARCAMPYREGHTFQILTKRADRMRMYLTTGNRADLVAIHAPLMRAWPLPNVWLGVSVEDQRRADERIPLLLQTPAAVRFISAEPLLGPVDLECVGPLGGTLSALGCIPCAWKQSVATTQSGPHTCGELNRGERQRLSWVIVGGESGPGARPCALEWIESIVGQCKAASVPVFVKQLGAYVVSEERTAPVDMMSGPPEAYRNFRASNGDVWAWRMGTQHRKGGDIAEFPPALQVREFPT